MIWYSHLLKNFPQFVVIYTVSGFRVINEEELHDFSSSLALSMTQQNVGNLDSGSSDFSKSSLNIWKFLVHVVLKPCLENFKHYVASV